MRRDLLLLTVLWFAGSVASGEGIPALSWFSQSPPPPVKCFETNIPALTWERNGDAYDFHVYMKGDLSAAGSPRVHLTYFYFDKAHNKMLAEEQNSMSLKISLIDYEIRQLPGQGPRQLTDIGGKNILVDGDLSELRFSIPADKFPKSPVDENLTSGYVQVDFPNGQQFTRVVHYYPDELHAFTPNAQSKDGKLTVPVKIFADYLGGRDPKDYVDQLIKRFNQFWVSCNIELDVTGLVYFATAINNQAQHVIDLSPEYFYAMRALRQNFQGSGDVLALGWHPGNPLSENKHRSIFNQIGGVMMNFAAGKLTADTFKSELNQISPRQVIMFNNDGKTLAHEIGHVLLGPEHERSSSNLMSEGARGDQLTSYQCKKARENIAKNFANAEKAPSSAPAKIQSDIIQ